MAVACATDTVHTVSADDVDDDDRVACPPARRSRLGVCATCTGPDGKYKFVVVTVVHVDVVVDDVVVDVDVRRC
jgi:hypothetical protein